MLNQIISFITLHAVLYIAKYLNSEPEKKIWRNALRFNDVFLCIVNTSARLEQIIGMEKAFPGIRPHIYTFTLQSLFLAASVVGSISCCQKMTLEITKWLLAEKIWWSVNIREQILHPRWAQKTEGFSENCCCGSFIRNTSVMRIEAHIQRLQSALREVPAGGLIRADSVCITLHASNPIVEQTTPSMITSFEDADF